MLTKEITKLLTLINYFTLDFDECSSSASCHSDARCQNAIGSYTCSCRTGFTGNGKTECTGQ